MKRSPVSGFFCSLLRGTALALCLAGCHGFRPPPPEAPHALVRGIFAGGENDVQRDIVKGRGYEPHVTVCSGRKEKGRCNREVFPYVVSRTVSFRVPVGKPITITPYGLLGLDYKSSGNEVRMTTTKCHGESLTIVPRNRASYQFHFTYDLSTQKCSAEWKTNFDDEY